MNDINELQRKVNEIQGLIVTKKKLLLELATIDTQLNNLLSQTQIKKPTSKKRSLAHSLNFYIMRVMAPGAHMSPKEIATKVKEAGYQTNNEKFTGYIHKIINKREDIKKVRFGVYARMDKSNQNDLPKLTLGQRQG